MTQIELTRFRIKKGKEEKVSFFHAGIFPDHDFVWDQTCHGRNQRTEAAEVTADDQALPLWRKPRKEQSGGHIADDLACDYGNDFHPAV